LAIVVALNAVVGLAYYVRASVALFGRDPGAAAPAWPRVPVAVGAALLLVTVAGLVIGFAPQLVLDAAFAVGR
jgi:NADH-quinone oxidoreductase subunit N